MNTEIISPRLREEFVSLIAQQTGIEIKSQNYGAMGDCIINRMRELNLPNPESYYELLASETSESEEEWQRFVCLITNKESYFFRDKGQFKLLRQVILPELIRNNQRIKTLRICSAGCSAGQEPYSVAILIRELIPDWEDWQVDIIGLDINRESLKQAQKALYNTWSFRQVEEEIKRRYFKNLGGYYQLNEEIKRLVRFRQFNLVRDEMPNAEMGLSDMDLIICRNVFIYFTETAIDKVVMKFYNTLRPNGYLITGHAELSNNQVKVFQTKIFPESVVYQRRGGKLPAASVSVSKTNTTTIQPKPQTFRFSTPQSPPPSPPVTMAIPPANSPKPIINPPPPITFVEEELLAEARRLIQQKSYYLAEKKLQTILRQSPHHYTATYLMAEINANLGRYDVARKWCHAAMSLDNLQVKPYLLLAQIEEEEGNIEEAKEALKRVIYLQPDHFMAYLSLANLYQNSGDMDRSKKLRNTALKILERMPKNHKIEELDDISVGDLLRQLQDISA
ncbi:MAG: tetratricopeptide repeat protein [Geminocystis sp.]|nr:tetratricopeptide repeat protein [Geminocystis sp.]MDW8116725.1 CheR family methyltransferase [Geminocystis sp.]